MLDTSGAAAPAVDWFRMRTPGDRLDIQQASDLCWGRIGTRTGLWTCCDRNGQHSAGRIYFFSPATLARLQPGGKVIADEEFTIVPPQGSWDEFAAASRGAGAAVLDDVRRRMVTDAQRADEPYLDLEALTIAPATGGPGGSHLFVVAEEPHSAVLELAIEEDGEHRQARVVALYAYRERPEEQGTAKNDGLEGFAYSGMPGLFYFAEEGTRDAQNRPSALLLFADPRVGIARLRDGVIEPGAAASEALTAAVRGQRKGPMQTMNGLCLTRDGHLLALDRNGGWILRVDAKARTAEPWLNLYDLGGQDLRKILAKVPHERKLPYVSIEGLAIDEAGDLWLVDDPAIPEGFRESTLLRIRLPAGTPPAASGAASGATSP